MYCRLAKVERVTWKWHSRLGKGSRQLICINNVVYYKAVLFCAISATQCTISVKSITANINFSQWIKFHHFRWYWSMLMKLKLQVLCALAYYSQEFEHVWYLDMGIHGV